MTTYQRTVFVTLPIQVDFSYQPYERPDCGPEARYPGCAEAVEIEGAFFGRCEITSELRDDEWKEIESELWNVINQERAA